MNTNPQLHDLGNSSGSTTAREMLNNGTLARYIAELSVTGRTSNPTIFEHAIGCGVLYDAAIQKRADKGLPSEDIFVELALRGLTQAADLFRPIFDASSGGDGWMSLVSLAARERHHRNYPGCRSPARASRAPEPLHQDPRYA